jgi:cold shock CspA family protein
VIGAFSGVRIGRVAAYDAGRGLGTIRDEQGGHPFHCTAITDGSREIEEGEAVAFVLRPHQAGVIEARSVTKLSDQGEEPLSP